MKCLQLLSLRLDDEPRPLNVYQGTDLETIHVQPAFMETRNLISTIGRHLLARSEDDPESFWLLYKYHDQSLEFSIAVPSRLEDVVLRSIPSATWGAVSNWTASTMSEPVLAGAVDPLILNHVDRNLLDELIETHHDIDFEIAIQVCPVGSERLHTYLRWLENEIKIMSKERSVSRTVQEGLPKRLGKSVVGGAGGPTTQTEDADADFNYVLAKQHFNTLRANLPLGFTAEITVVASSDDVKRQIATAVAAFSGRSSNPTRHRVYALNMGNRASGEGGWPEALIRLWKPRWFSELSPDKLASVSDLCVTANEIAALASIPFQARPGLVYEEFERFGSEPQTLSDSQQGPDRKIHLGNLDVGYTTRIPVEIMVDDLTRHGLVTGVTGSGKTTTIKHMLSACHDLDVPFMVVEPAKSEYRSLPMVQGRVFRLGQSHSDQFRMNPLAFPEGIHVQTHMDLIKSVFNAAFPMYGPMPYLLETALLRCYRQRGWDFKSGLNVYGGQLPRTQLFPTLDELLGSIRYITTTAGYSDDLTSDVRAALEVRIGSLLIGAKGQLLNTRQPLDVERLLAEPCVVELEAIGDGHEKAFIMGLILTQVYEHYIARGTASNRLKHLIVMEEAHRLWENRQEAASLEVADTKGNAVQTMNQILSEIRAYGQGVIVADQIPLKLAPDVVKNTNLKIIHRLFAHDDRQWVGRAVGLTDEQIDYLVHLKQGAGVMFWDGLDKAVLARVVVDDATLKLKAVESSQAAEDPIGLPVNLLLADDEFIAEGCRLIRTALLFPRIEKRLSELIGRLVSRRGISTLPPEGVSFLKRELAMRLVGGWVADGSCSPIEQYEAEVALFEGRAVSLSLWNTLSTMRESVPDAAVYGLLSDIKKFIALLPVGWDSEMRIASLFRTLVQRFATSYR